MCRVSAFGAVPLSKISVMLLDVFSRITASILTDFRGFRLMLGVGLMLSVLACQERQILQPAPQDLSQVAYFPLEIGKYTIYQVDSILFDFAPGGATIMDTSLIFVKEVVADTLRDQTGQLVYSIERYERKALTDNWTLKAIQTSSRTSTQAIRTENNWRYLKLVFPLSKRSEWDGNLWIDENREIEFSGERMRPFTNWRYEVDSIDVPALIGPFAFDSTLLVTEADDNNVIERRFSRVRYAKHIGLVWREQWILDSQYCNQNPVPIDCETRPWELKAEKGYILRQQILEYN